MTALDSKSEQRAEEAQQLHPFQDLNLLGVKSKVADALELIGRSQIFKEYTLHDIRHVDRMLESLDWLVPTETAGAMSPADWLLSVLGIYLHDLGMLVTDSEFAAREDSDFLQFCETELFAGESGTDYKSKVERLGSDSDRFLYQEYVRSHHAARIGDWIRGRLDPRRGVAPETVETIREILKPLPDAFRHDLALVCESHHLNDLYDTEKYPVAQPYGNSDDCTANVQYAAVLLRTADLLHITDDRTPSVMFRLVNPQDPVSQREWAKQKAVRRVKDQKGKDPEGNLSDAAPRSVVEVFATFENADAFFGLTSYLVYAERQLKQSVDWIESSAARFALPHKFPWRAVDTGHVRAEGFSPQQLSFTLDQGKILDLLTGHTIYNDTSVVLRELTQNAIDAVRLQEVIDADAQQGGQVADREVFVQWNPDSRELLVRDSGTGMSKAVIEKNLLKAGSSRYQEEPFRKRYPEFSPISRFGIGVLSAFMIADSVTVTTCSPEDEKVHQLTLRSVHGRYLLRLLDKQVDPLAQKLFPHGTEVKLRVRESAKLPDVLQTLRRWIVIPRCKVRARIVGQEGEHLIGFASPEDALRAALVETGLDFWNGAGDPRDQELKVVETEDGAVSTALALQWSSYFREWRFFAKRDQALEIPLAYGTCVEGVRVEEATPGFEEALIPAITDARGVDAPKTNVARVGLDATRARREMLLRVYGAFLRHISNETEALQMKRGFSLTWAANEAELFLEQVIRKRGDLSHERKEASPLDGSALREAIRQQPLLLVEENGIRKLAAAVVVEQSDRVWTVDSKLIRAAEEILREIPAEGSLHAIASGFETGAFTLPDGITLVGYEEGSSLYPLVLEGREVSSFAIRRNERRVDVGWELMGAESKWLALRGASTVRRDRGWEAPVYVARVPLELVGLEDEVAIRAHSVWYLLPDSAIAEWAVSLMDSLSDRDTRRLIGEVLSDLLQSFFSRLKMPDDPERFVVDRLERSKVRDSGIIDIGSLSSALGDTSNKAFDTSAWTRHNLFYL